VQIIPFVQLFGHSSALENLIVFFIVVFKSWIKPLTHPKDRYDAGVNGRSGRGNKGDIRGGWYSPISLSNGIDR